MPLFPSFNGCVEGIRDWIHQMELSLKKEHVLGAESQQGASDVTEQLERLENLHKQLLDKRFVDFCTMERKKTQHTKLKCRNVNQCIYHKPLFCP